METFLYFAYGSNLLTERLQARCSTALCIGNANAVGYKLVFNQKSDVDQSAKANLFHTGHDDDIVKGVLFAINKNEESQLDKAEGYNKDNPKAYSYLNETISVTYNSEEVPATTYFAHISNESIPDPVYDWYFALIVAGALQHRLSDKYIKDLIDGTVPKVDPDAKRPRRLEALSILEQTGFMTVYKELSQKVAVEKNQISHCRAE